MMVMIQVEVFWVVTLCNVMVGYQCFRDPCCLHVQGHFTLKMEVACTSEMAVSYHKTTQTSTRIIFRLNTRG